MYIGDSVRQCYLYVFSRVMALYCTTTWCDLLGKTALNAPSFSWLPIVVCVRLGPCGLFPVHPEYTLVLSCSAYVWTIMLVRLYGYNF